jgi:hypothetical protein
MLTGEKSQNDAQKDVCLTCGCDVAKSNKSTTYTLVASYNKKKGSLSRQSFKIKTMKTKIFQGRSIFGAFAEAEDEMPSGMSASTCIVSWRPGLNNSHG